MISHVGQLDTYGIVSGDEYSVGNMDQKQGICNPREPPTVCILVPVRAFHFILQLYNSQLSTISHSISFLPPLPNQMRLSTLLFASTAIITASAKVDSLVSKRSIEKRYLDAEGNYNITVVHTNDVHAHLDQWRAGRGTDCTPGSECISGYARIKQKISELRESLQDPVFLNAGDEFQVSPTKPLSFAVI